MNITIEVDARRASALLRGLPKQSAFAASRAINETAKDFQKAQRAGQRQRFTVRRPFADLAVKIKPFATPDRLEAIVSIDPPGGKSRADILTKFELGGTKRPQGRSLAVPDAAWRGKGGVIPRGDRPRALFEGTGKGKAAARGTVFRRKGTRVLRRSSRYEVLQGRRGTFLIRDASGRGLILQRKGGATSVLYRLTPQARIDDRLRFVDTARRVVDQRLEGHLRRELARALATAR